MKEMLVAAFLMSTCCLACPIRKTANKLYAKSNQVGTASAVRWLLAPPSRCSKAIRPRARAISPPAEDRCRIQDRTALASQPGERHRHLGEL